VKADENNSDPVTVQLYLNVYQTDDSLQRIDGAAKRCAPGESVELIWKVPDTGALPIAHVGIQLSQSETAGTIYLDSLTWDGCPDVVFTRVGERPRWGSKLRPMWLRAWINGVDQLNIWMHHSFELIQNEGRGIVSQGTRDWMDYTASARIYVYLASAAGLAVRVQGLQRYYALLLSADGKARLVKALGGETTLAETDFTLERDHAYDLKLNVMGSRLRGWIDGQQVFDVQDTDRPLEGGAVALICDEGRIGTNAVAIMPVSM
jgi:hypothetical protein